MSITRHHSGRWYFQFDSVIAGRRTRANKLLPKGWTRAKALEWDQRETARLWDVATGGQRDEHLIADAVLVYLEQHAPTLKNTDDIIGALALLEPWYSGKRLSELPEVARTYAAEAKAEDGKTPLRPGTIRNRLAYLRAACRWAWQKHKMGEHDPAERMILPRVKNARHVYLSRAEMLRIARAMGLSWSRDLVRVAFYTGMRAGEILRSTVEGEGEDLSLSIPDSKNGLPRIVPVHGAIAHLVRAEWPPQVTIWTASKAFKAAARAVGLGHTRLHDLRHSAASEMVNAGVDLFTIGGVLGHKSSASTARYAHLAQERLRDAVKKIGARRPHPRPEAKAA
jgi:integrase